jgi:hypothetical protein
VVRGEVLQVGSSSEVGGVGFFRDVSAAEMEEEEERLTCCTLLSICTFVLVQQDNTHRCRESSPPYRPCATSACGLQLLVYEAFSCWYMRP